MDARGEPIWTVAIADPRLSRSANVCACPKTAKSSTSAIADRRGAVLRFDLRSLTLSRPPPNDGLTFAPKREGLTIDGWRNGTRPTLDGRALPFANV